MNATSRLCELQYENDMWLKTYIYNVIMKGFDIVDDASVVKVYDCHNYKSALVGDAAE